MSWARSNSMSTWCMKFSPRMTAVSPKSCSPTTSMRQFLRTSLPMANSSIDTVSTAVSPPIPNMRSVRLPCRTRPRRSAAPRRISVCVAPVSIPMPTFWPLIAPSTTTCPREDRTGHSATRTSVHFAGAAWADSPATIVAVASAVDTNAIRIAELRMTRLCANGDPLTVSDAPIYEHGPAGGFGKTVPPS